MAGALFGTSVLLMNFVTFYHYTKMTSGWFFKIAKPCWALRKNTFNAPIKLNCQSSLIEKVHCFHLFFNQHSH